MKRMIPIAVLFQMVYSMTMAQPANNFCGNERHNPLYDARAIELKEAIEKHTQEYLENIKKIKTAAGTEKIMGPVITIPVVVHIIYNTPEQNLPDAQIISQLDVLNEAFSASNFEIPLDVFPGFTAGNPNIQFCLAQRDPSNNATTGIIRIPTNTTGFISDNKVKNSSTGGHDGWDRNKYLNIWICNLTDVLGYSSGLSDPASIDGIVIHYKNVGISTSNTPVYNNGRIGVHEAGHWLNLLHLNGENGDNCGTDFCNDTPPQTAAVLPSGCSPNLVCCNIQTTPPSSCAIPNFQNYMQVGINDDCRIMFTPNQCDRMRALFSPGGFREPLLYSDGCVPLGCATPTNVTSSYFTPTSATVSWTPVLGALSYEVEYWVTGYPNTLRTTTTTNISTTLTTLIPESPYLFTVRANCNNGLSSAKSYPVSFVTYGGAATYPACYVDVWELNNTIATAKTISVNTNIYGTIYDGADKDYYKFFNLPGQTNIQITLTNLPANYKITLITPLGTSSTSNKSGTSNETITYNTSFFGEYKLLVEGSNTSAFHRSCYTLRANIRGVRYFTNNYPATTASSLLQDGETAAINTNKTIAVYPNPSQGDFIVEFEALNPGNLMMILYDITGRQIRVQNTAALEGLNNISFECGQLSDGIYLLELQDGTGTYTQKVQIGY